MNGNVFLIRHISCAKCTPGAATGTATTGFFQFEYRIDGIGWFYRRNRRVGRHTNVSGTSGIKEWHFGGFGHNDTHGAHLFGGKDIANDNPALKDSIIAKNGIGVHSGTIQKQFRKRYPSIIPSGVKRTFLVFSCVLLLSLYSTNVQMVCNCSCGNGICL
jgi:hypothetical protein